MIKGKPAIIADYDTLRDNIHIQNFLITNTGNFELVLFVTNPDDAVEADFERTTMVISNTGYLSDRKFKIAALAAVQMMSTLTAAVMFDDDPDVLADAARAGVLITFTGETAQNYLETL